MGSLLDNVEKSLLDGNIEVFKNLLMTELSNRDKIIDALVVELTYTKERIEVLERKQETLLDRNEFEYLSRACIENYKKYEN